MPNTDSTIAGDVAAYHAKLRTQAPAAIVDVFAGEQRALDVAGVPAGVAVAGTPMPDAPLVDALGVATTLAAARDGKPAVVVFYRGSWCPYCNIALRAYERDLVPALRSRGVALLAISPEKPDGSLTLREKHALTFATLSDAGNALARALGIATAPSGAARRAQSALGIEVPAANADGTDGVPMPTVVVVDATGTIRWIDVHPNYTSRSEASEILAAVDASL